MKLIILLQYTMLGDGPAFGGALGTVSGDRVSLDKEFYTPFKSYKHNYKLSMNETKDTVKNSFTRGKIPHNGVIYFKYK